MSERNSLSGKNKYPSERSSSRKQNFGPVILCLLALFILAVIFYCLGGISVYSSSSADIAEISNTVSRLARLEQRSPVDAASVKKNREVNVDIDLLKAELLEHYGDYDYNAENFRRWFEDAAIVGDSVAEAIKEFEWVNEVNVQSEIGIGLYSSENVIEGTEWLMPSTIFLTFSANNIKSYDVYVEGFINDYTGIITRLRESIPYAEIYVQGILPCHPDRVWEYPYYEYLDEYNSAIMDMCEELGVHYFDMGFVCEANPDIYAEDGIHPRWPFYPLWLTYMAEISGLAEQE